MVGMLTAGTNYSRKANESSDRFEGRNAWNFLDLRQIHRGEVRAGQLRKLRNVDITRQAEELEKFNGEVGLVKLPEFQAVPG